MLISWNWLYFKGKNGMQVHDAEVYENINFLKENVLLKAAYFVEEFSLYH